MRTRKTGCNVENSSYGLCICAERTAVVKAVSEGYRKFKACFVKTKSANAIGPCGACRQFLSEVSVVNALNLDTSEIEINRSLFHPMIHN